MRLFPPVLVAFLLSFPLAANDSVYRRLQSGSSTGPASIHARGIFGQGQTIAVLDTGLDYDNCYFAESDGSPPPTNTVLADGTLEASNVDPSRRKVIAYNFLYSCTENGGAAGCDDPADPRAWDNQGHGTHAAAVAAGDKGARLVHDPADSIAPGAKLVIQDAGYIGGDNCSQRPGLGCPLRDLRPVLAQAYAQGARIHTNSWGDRQGIPPPFTPPTANYSQAAAEIDAFVFENPDMLVVFNSGNAGQLGSRSASAPGVAKNAIQVGGVVLFEGEEAVAAFSGRGPTEDGRIKPDLVAPAIVTAGDSDFDVTTGACDVSRQTGTSWSAPAVAGAAALVREYFEAGFYPAGIEDPRRATNPSAALVKAMLIASASPVRWDSAGGRLVETESVPSSAQGFGVPVLDDALFFQGEEGRLIVRDVRSVSGLQEGDRSLIRINVSPGIPLKVVLVWTDPPSSARGGNDETAVLTNDLDLVVTRPGSVSLLGNDFGVTGRADRLNNVELVSVESPEAGMWTIAVDAGKIAAGPKQGFSLVITGGVTEVSRTRPARR